MNKYVFGGLNYIWKGRNIICGQAAVSLLSNDSMIFVPCVVESKMLYKVTVSALKKSGSGMIMIGFMAGNNCEGNRIPIVVDSANFKEYVSFVPAPEILHKNQTYCRVIGVSAAQITIKFISIEKVSLDARDKVEFEPKDMFETYEDKDVSSIARKVLVAKKSDLPLVSIITPTRDGIDLLKNCYSALIRNTIYPNWEWIVGDSLSTDGTVEYIKALKDSRVKLIERGTVEGSYSSINNELVKHSLGEYLVFLNNDTEPQPFWLFTMMSKIYDHPEIGIVGPRLEYPPGGNIQCAGITFTQPGPGHVLLSSMYPPGFSDEDRYFQAVTGACQLMRKTDYEAVGGMSTEYYFCYDDVDLCLKIRKHLGKKVLYAASAKVFHAESKTSQKFPILTNVIKNNLLSKGVSYFHRTWMKDIDLDAPTYNKHPHKGEAGIDISFVSCVKDMDHYIRCIGSLLKNKTNRRYEIIPIINFGNKYSAAQALNIGINKSKGNIIVLCHDDVIFYEGWVDLLYKRIAEIEKQNQSWGVLGTAGVCVGKTKGVPWSVYGIKDKCIIFDAQDTVSIAQTVDEHCMIIRKSSGLMFDEKICDGFHFYGADLCLSAIDKGLNNYGIVCPLIHNGTSRSIQCGRNEFDRQLAKFLSKWGHLEIRTTTIWYKNGKVMIYPPFWNKEAR